MPVFIPLYDSDFVLSDLGLSMYFPQSNPDLTINYHYLLSKPYLQELGVQHSPVYRRVIYQNLRYTQVYIAKNGWLVDPSSVPHFSNRSDVYGSVLF